MKTIERLRLIRTHHNAIIPTKVDPTTPMMTFYNLEEVVVPGGGVQKARTGIKFCVPSGFYAHMVPSPNLTYKRLHIAEQIVFPGKNAELIVVLVNQTVKDQKLKPRDALLTLMFAPFVAPKIINIKRTVEAQKESQIVPGNKELSLRERPVSRSSRGPYDTGSSSYATSSSEESGNEGRPVARVGRNPQSKSESDDEEKSDDYKLMESLVQQMLDKEIMEMEEPLDRTSDSEPELVDLAND